MAIFYTDSGSISNLEVTNSLLISGSLIVSGGVTFVQGTNLVTASSAAPSSPPLNTLWYDADSGKTYIRFDDGTSTQWVLQSDPTLDVNRSLQTLQEVTDLGPSSSNAIRITNTTESTSKTSGALIVSGGLGVGGNIYANKYYGDGSALTGVTGTTVEVDTLQSVTDRGNTTSTNVILTATGNSTSKTTGVLRVAGGVGVEKDIWADNLFVTTKISGSQVTGSFFGDGSGITGIPGTDTFKTISVAGQNNVIADSNADTLTFVAGTNMTITTSDTTDTITFTSAGGNSFATFSVPGQTNVIADQSLDTMTLVGGSGIGISTDAATDTITFTWTGSTSAGVNVADEGTNVGTATSINFIGDGVTATFSSPTASVTIARHNTFATFSIAGQSDVIADAVSDTLTLAAGANITLTTNATNDTITIESTGGGGGGGNVNSNRASLTLYDPTNAEDITMMYTSSSITINKVFSVLRGSAGQSVTISLHYATTRNAAGTAIVSAQAVTATSSIADVTKTVNTTVDAGNFIWLETSATAGTVNELFVQFTY